MRKIVVAAVAALAFLVPARSHALVFAGVRAGYAMPSGDVAKDAPMKDTVSSSIPIQVDAGVSVLSILSLGVYASYGASQLATETKDACRALGASCSGQNLRGGLQLNLRPPVVLNALWGGVFAGFEQQQIKGGPVDRKFRGWEAGLQAGYDFSALPFIKVGPFASYSIAQFTSASGAGAELGTKAQHTALTFGLRGLFDF